VKDFRAREVPAKLRRSPRGFFSTDLSVARGANGPAVNGSDNGAMIVTAPGLARIIPKSSGMEQPTAAERAREEAFRASLEVDDEPLDDDDLAALAEPWDPVTAVSLDAHFARRTPRGS
jgi:hypothetical protein